MSATVQDKGRPPVLSASRSESPQPPPHPLPALPIEGQSFRAYCSQHEAVQLTSTER